MKEQLINLTPHPLNFPDRTIESSGVARVSATSEVVGDFDGVDVYRVTYGDVVGLPEPQSRVRYVVSRMTAAAAPDRMDLVVTSNIIRDDQGKIIGAKGVEFP